MSHKKYIVDLREEDIQELEQVIRSGKHSARKLTRARILLQAYEGKSDSIIAANLRVSLSNEIKAWQEQRNSQKATVNWCFLSADARIKLERLYPLLESKG